MCVGCVSNGEHTARWSIDIVLRDRQRSVGINRMQEAISLRRARDAQFVRNGGLLDQWGRQRRTRDTTLSTSTEAPDSETPTSRNTNTTDSVEYSGACPKLVRTGHMSLTPDGSSRPQDTPMRGVNLTVVPVCCTLSQQPLLFTRSP